MFTRLHVTLILLLVAFIKNIIRLHLSIYVRVCTRVWMRAGARVCVCVCEYLNSISNKEFNIHRYNLLSYKFYLFPCVNEYIS